jgi:uncharacterized protein (DUF1697 family)
MRELRQVFAGLGFGDVATYIQSGNVVFTCSPRSVAELTADIEGGILSAVGFEVPVAIRSAEQLNVVASGNPFVRRGADVAALSVGFLSGVPEPGRVSGLLADPVAELPAGDEFSLNGQHVYLHHPNGYGRSKLTNSYFDRRLGTMMTVRSWRTVMTFLEMTGGLGAGPLT